MDSKLFQANDTLNAYMTVMHLRRDVILCNMAEHGSILQAVQSAVQNADRYYRVTSEGQQRDPVTMAKAFKVQAMDPSPSDHEWTLSLQTVLRCKYLQYRVWQQSQRGSSSLDRLPAW